MMHFGPISVGLPTGIVQVSDAQLAKLECAMIWSAAGFPALAERAVADVESGLRDEAERRQRVATEARAARAQSIAVRPDPRTLDDADLILIRQADDHRLRAADLHAQANAAKAAKKHPRAKILRAQAKGAEHQATRLAMRVGRRIESRVDEGLAKDALDTALVTEIRRGGEVDDVETFVSEFVRDERGVLVQGEDGLPLLRTHRAVTRRVNERTGLQLAYSKGDLDGDRICADDLYEEGKRYADNYRTAHGVMTGDKPDVRLPPGPRGRQLQVAMATAHLIIARGRGEGGTSLSPRQVWVLDLICGEDCSINATAVQLKAGVPSIRRALRESLAVARRNRIAAEKIKRQAKGDGS